MRWSPSIWAAGADDDFTHEEDPMMSRASLRRKLGLMGVLVLVLAAATVATAITAEHEIPGTALPVGRGALSVSGAVDADSGPTDDVYRLWLGRGDVITMSLDTSDTASLALNLFAPDAGSIANVAGMVETTAGSAFPVSWTHTASVDGTYYPDVRAIEGTATYTLSYRRLLATSVLMSRPTLVPGTDVTRVTARAEDSAGEPAVQGRILFSASTDRVTWVQVADVEVNSRGMATSSYRPVQRTYLRARYSGAGDYLPSAESTSVISAPPAHLTAPSGPTTVSAWTPFTVAGYLGPRHRAGGHDVVLAAYRKEAGRWILQFKVPTTNSDDAGRTRYSTTLSLPGSGPATWKIVASVAEDSAHAATVSRPLYVTVPMFSFKTLGFQARDLPQELQPFSRSVPMTISGDPDEAVMRVIDGVPYDMALRQAEMGYAYVYSYRLTGDDWHIRRARAQADRLISMHASEGDGWFFPSTFHYAFDHNYGGELVPPWYSGIAQGAAAGFFARLYETTGETKYRDAAEHAMESFLIPRRVGHIWTSAIDSLRYLRLEEYPDTNWEFVFNGHMEAALGLYDYYRVTSDPRALALYRGALTTVLKYAEQLRNPGWMSAYAMTPRAQYRMYHQRVVGQLLQLYTVSGDVRFVHLANEFDDDYPWPTIPPRMSVAPGNREAFRFSATGSITARRMVRNSSGLVFDLISRGRVRNQQGVWLTVKGGSLDGYCLRESPGSVYARGVAGEIHYRPAVQVALGTGRWTGQKVDADGRVTQTVTVSIQSVQKVGVSERAVVNGSPRVKIASGSLAGYWVPSAAIAMP